MKSNIDKILYFMLKSNIIFEKNETRLNLYIFFIKLLEKQ